MENNNNLDPRFQQDQHVDPATGTDVDNGQGSYVVQTLKRSGGKLKQEIAAQVINSGKGTGGVDSLSSVTLAGRKPGSYTGDGAAALGNFANTPELPTDRQGSTREDKKLSDPNKDINLMASEQYATYFEQPKALAEDKESTVGYNGNPTNISARSQKNSGATPAELLFDRSVDEIRADQAIFVTGQTIGSTVARKSMYPTKTWWDSINGKPAMLKPIEFSDGKAPVRGNYMPNAITVGFKRDTKNGPIYLNSFTVDETDLSYDETSPDVVNDSSAALSIDMNRAELTRQAIDNSHGSPDDQAYNPLGRSVTEPSKTVSLLMDMEQVAGSIMVSSVRFAAKQRAYFLSRTGKDGIEQSAPAIDALYGHLLGANDSDSTNEKFVPDTSSPYISHSLNKRGSAAILIEVFDSISKYGTKADIVNQPRGLKMPLQTGLNNHTPFHVSDDYVKALNAIDVFSTIDRDYDPSAPVMVSDGLAYILPYSWKNMLNYARTSYGGERVYGSELFCYAYQAGKGNQRYYIKVAEPVLNGVAWFLEQYADRIAKALGIASDAGSTVTLTIPVRSYTTHFSLFDYLICAASAYICYERTNSMKDVIDYEGVEGYPFKHMSSVSKETILTPTNYGAISMFDRLKVKQMLPATAMRWIMPELFTPVGDDTMLPFYFSESNFDDATVYTTKDGAITGIDDGQVKIRMKGDATFYGAPVIRSGVALSYLDDFYGMTLKDQLLCLDKMSKVPGYNREVPFPGYFYKYGVDSEGIAVFKGDVSNTIKASTYIATPRQIGWVMFVPEGVTQWCTWTTSDPFKDTVIQGLNGTHSSFRARAYSGANSSKPSGILAQAVVSIARNTAFSQKWAEAYASHKSTDSENFDVMLSYASAFTRSGDNITAVLNKSSFKPWATTGTDMQYTGNKPVFANMRALWARVQKLPFICNPFDAGVENSNIGAIDPFDFAYLFGLAGFMMVTYHEEESNRISDKFAKMFNFTEDPYFVNSPLFKG